MARLVSARRYAQAIYQLAVEKDHLENWTEDLSVLAASISDELFVSFADSPKVETDQKTAVIKEAFAGSISDLAMNLVCLLAARSSVSSLPAIADSFQELVDGEKG
ncbi:MAG: ATP synthase F1 subunit delta, partial [Dehalococcoidia bacterium]